MQSEKIKEFSKARARMDQEESGKGDNCKGEEAKETQPISIDSLRITADELQAARISAGGEIYHFSTSQQISIRALVEMIADRLGVSFEDNVEIVEDRPGKDEAYLLDNAKATQILHWKDTLGLEDGIEETIAWVKDNLTTLQKQSFDYIHKP